MILLFFRGRQGAGVFHICAPPTASGVHILWLSPHYIGEYIREAGVLGSLCKLTSDRTTDFPICPSTLCRVPAGAVIIWVCDWLNALAKCH